MGWKLKTTVLLSLGILLVVSLGFGYVVYARYQGNAYAVQIAASFNAASLVNGQETYTQPDRAVVSSYEGRRFVILPDNYNALVSLLRKDHAMPPFRRVGEDAPLSIVICDSARLRIAPDGDSVDGAFVCYTDDAGKQYTMHVRGGNIWKQLVEYATTGYAKRRNLAL